MNFEMSHPVDDSDIAFCMRLDRSSTICSMMGSKGAARHRVSTSLDAFINLPTLNYILAGIQLCYVPSHRDKSKWHDLLYDMDQVRFKENDTKLGFMDIRYIVRELIRPFGVIRGSEKQGGQDETGLASATWPVNFVANIVLDGKDRDVNNIWHYHDVDAGDDLVLRLKPMPIPRGRDCYTLNHYYKRYVQQNFESFFGANLGAPKATHVWQLVPDVFTLDGVPENDHTHGAFPQHGQPFREPLPGVRMSPGFDVPKDYIWQEHGFWHIGRSQIMVRKYAPREFYNNDMAGMLKVNHLDMTFEPTWVKVPGETRDAADPRAVVTDYSTDPRYTVDARRDGTFVAPGMMAGGKRARWAPDLKLEAFLHAPMPSGAGARGGAAVAGEPMDAEQDPADSAERLFGSHPAGGRHLTQSGESAAERLFGCSIAVAPGLAARAAPALQRPDAAEARSRALEGLLGGRIGRQPTAPRDVYMASERQPPTMRDTLMESMLESPPPPLRTPARVQAAPPPPTQDYGDSLLTASLMGDDPAGGIGSLVASSGGAPPASRTPAPKKPKKSAQP